MHTITIQDILTAKDNKPRAILASSLGRKRLSYDYQFEAYTVEDLTNEYNVQTTADVKEAVALYNTI